MTSPAGRAAVITRAELDAIRALVRARSWVLASTLVHGVERLPVRASDGGDACSQATRSPPALPLDQQRALQRQQADEASLKLAGTLKVGLGHVPPAGQHLHAKRLMLTRLPYSSGSQGREGAGTPAAHHRR